MDTILALIPPQYLVYVLAVGGIASIAASLMPSPAVGASGWYPVAYKVVNFAAVNLGHARNATSPITGVSPHA